MIRRFVKVSKRMGLRITADKDKVMALGWKEGSVYEVFVHVYEI